MRSTMLVLAGLVLALMFLWQGGETISTGPASLVRELLDREGAVPSRGEALYWGRVNQEYLGLPELEALAERITNSLGIEPEGPRERLKEENFTLVDISGRLSPGIAARVILQSKAPAAGAAGPEPGETFLLVQLLQEGGAFEVLEAGRRMARLLHPYAGGDLTLDVTAYLPGRLQPGEMKQKARALLDEAGAEVVEAMEGDNLVSLTGYTPRVAEHLYLGSEKININMALRYDGYRDATVLRLGFPLIAGGY